MSTLRKTMSTSTSFDVAHGIKCTRPSLRFSLGGQRSYVNLLREEGGPGTEARLGLYMRGFAVKPGGVAKRLAAHYY